MVQPTYEVIKSGGGDILKLDYETSPYVPSIEDNPMVMMDVIDKMVANPSVQRIIFTQRRNFEYGAEQVKILREIVDLYSYLIQDQRVLSLESMGIPSDSPAYLSERFEIIRDIVFNRLRADPVAAYVEIRRWLRDYKVRMEAAKDPMEKQSLLVFVKLLGTIEEKLDSTKLIRMAKPFLAGMESGDRSVYRNIFRPSITPDFMFTQIMAAPPIKGEIEESYQIGEGYDKSDVVIYSVPDDIKKLYHITPPEFKLPEEKYELIDMAKKVLSEHQPRDEEFLDPEKMRSSFNNISKDLLRELASQSNILLTPEELDAMSQILIRHTIGFGVIEIMLQDPKIQDITINAPAGETPLFLLHASADECYTNIIPSRDDYESWASKFRLLSGRPFDEANPILDTELILPKARSRVSLINKPLNPYGIAMAFRRHADRPWTLAKFIKVRYISPLAAGLMSFLIDGNRTMLVAGTRSSGKTSLLGSLLLEIMRKYRILTCEDTLELPGEHLRKLGYNIQPLKVRSALVKGGSEVSAAEGIRSSLRLGDSALIVGEVRSDEAVSLYEAMRIGALANVVAGTIHGDSPYGVFDRVVNDLKVPATSFKATDIIFVANPLRSADGLHKYRRVTQITEVRKQWEEDPLREGGFVDLMKYDSRTDQLEPSQDLINGESDILKSIGANVKQWVGDWDAIWENVQLRANIKKKLVDYSTQTKDPEILEAPFVVQANDMFHRISDMVMEEVGSLDVKRIEFDWEEWLKRELRKRRM